MGRLFGRAFRDRGRPFRIAQCTAGRSRSSRIIDCTAGQIFKVVQNRTQLLWCTPDCGLCSRPVKDRGDAMVAQQASEFRVLFHTIIRCVAIRSRPLCRAPPSNALPAHRSVPFNRNSNRMTRVFTNAQNSSSVCHLRPLQASPAHAVPAQISARTRSSPGHCRTRPNHVDDNDTLLSSPPSGLVSPGHIAVARFRGC